MPDQPEEKKDRIPRAAIIVAALGILASLAIYGLSFVPGSGSIAIEWDTNEEIEAPPAERVGEGRFAVSRTSLAALAPNEDGLLIYRVAGVVRIASNGRQPTKVRCDITSEVAGDTRMARSKSLRAAWPRSSDNLQAQDVPETSYVKFQAGDASKIDLPIRDVVQHYTDSNASTIVKWDGYTEDVQSWIWIMSDGTGVGAATMPWVVIFEAEQRPKGTIDCTATVDSKRSRIKIPFRQQEWPIADDQPNEADAETGDVSNVE